MNRIKKLREQVFASQNDPTLGINPSEAAKEFILAVANDFVENKFHGDFQYSIFEEIEQLVFLLNPNGLKPLLNVSEGILNAELDMARKPELIPLLQHMTTVHAWLHRELENHLLYFHSQEEFRSSAGQSALALLDELYQGRAYRHWAEKPAEWHDYLRSLSSFVVSLLHIKLKHQLPF